VRTLEKRFATSDVPGQMKRQALLQLIDGGEISLAPRLAQLLESRVRPRHVPGMVLVVMQSQQLRRVTGLTRLAACTPPRGAD